MKKIYLLIIVLLILSGCSSKKEQRYFKTLDDLKTADKLMFATAASNSCYNDDILGELGDINIDEYSNYFDTFMEVANGNKDASFVFFNAFQAIKDAYPALICIQSDNTIPIAASFSRNSDKIRNDFNEYVENNVEYIAYLVDKWIDNYSDNNEPVDFTNLENINGVIKLAADPCCKPGEFLINGQPGGFELDLVYAFAREYGYAIEYFNVAYESVMTGISTGRYDMSVGFYGFTEERSEGMNFSKPFFYDHMGYVVLGEGSGEQLGFIDSFKERIDRNFIREDRWKLVVNGLLSTMEITFMAVFGGSVLGFGLFMLTRKYPILNKSALFIDDTFESLPTLVILLVFFYVIFGESTISGFTVSIMVFGLLFTFTFYKLLYGSVKGIDNGQNEAALALGYTANQALFKVVIPQAMDAFLPSYKSAIIATLKSTAIVGYVAVQDLSRAGDLIRSLTFDALVPILSVAFIYYIIARLLIHILDKVLIIDRKKNTDRYLKELR